MSVVVSTRPVLGSDCEYAQDFILQTELHILPIGMNKMVVNHLDKLIVTSDASTIVSELEVEHPAAKLLALAAKAQEQEIGDATNLVRAVHGRKIVFFHVCQISTVASCYKYEAIHDMVPRFSLMSSLATEEIAVSKTSYSQTCTSRHRYFKYRFWHLEGSFCRMLRASCAAGSTHQKLQMAI